MPTKPFYAIARLAEAQVRAGLDFMRIVALVGPRQSGKTTLARQIAQDRGMNFVSLDDDQTRSIANDDPGGFIQGLDYAVIDEVQWAPDLMLALKKTVDEDQRRGRFLITGSVDLFKGAISPDSLAGRVRTIELLPLSQLEIAGRTSPIFLDQAFNGDFPALAETGQTPDLIERALAGGYPEALVQPNPSLRQHWLRDYAKSLAVHDAIELSDILKTDELARLLDHAAAAAGQLANLSTLASPLGVDSKTVDRWLILLERMFVLRRIRAWHRNDLKRLVRAPKLHFLDTGLLSALRRVNIDDIRADRGQFGRLLEGFVFSEIEKLAAASPDETRISHYRDKDKAETDFVLERGRRVVGIEVKASTSVKPEDFRILKRLKQVLGSKFVCGILMHDGDRIQQFGDGLFAMPVGQLWA